MPERQSMHPDNREPEVGSDNPAQDAQKGEKTLKAMQDSRSS